jgi:integrase/recombinase XerC
MLDSFLSYLQYERRSSNHTILSYKNDLIQFENFLLNNSSNLSIARYNLIRAWIISLVEAGNNPHTVNRKIASLRAYYKFLLRKEVITEDPTIKLRLLKAKKAIPHFIEEARIIDVLEDREFDINASDFIRTRNRLIIELFYGTGIRLSELVNIKISNLSTYESVLKVIGKRNKERVIPINATLLPLIKEYLILKEKEYTNLTHDYLFITSKGEQVYPKLVYRVVKNRLNMVTNLEKRSPHVLRHTFATHLLDKGADLNAIKDLLGHTSLAATQVYTHNSLEKIKAIFTQAHPKA